ncbi:hypothetical protein A4U60_14405 [Priestia endophytica]|nr:hypothetical protein A4U60_14405 [Priestia endophytica]
MSKALIYLGNSNHPPDFVIKHGVAVEMKKIEDETLNPIVLNSSFLKDYLYHDNMKIKKNIASVKRSLVSGEEKI